MPSVRSSVPSRQQSAGIISLTPGFAQLQRDLAQHTAAVELARKTINFEHVLYSTSARNAPFDHVLKLPHDHIRSDLDANEGAAGRFGE